MRLGADLRGPFIAFFRALGEAMMTIVQWVLLLAPVGVPALVCPVTDGAAPGAVDASACAPALSDAVYTIPVGCRAMSASSTTVSPVW
jgi:hypothetical protein